MRSAARLVLAMMLVTALTGAGLLTLRRLADVDPRGRESWVAAPLSLTSTPRDVKLYVPACDVRAIVLHPIEPAAGLVEAEYWVPGADGSARRVGSATATATATRGATSSIVLTLGDVRPSWRTPLVLRLRAVDGTITLDPRRPITIDMASSSSLGTLACAFDSGSRARGWLLAAALLTIVVAGAAIGVAWLKRGFEAGSTAQWLKMPLAASLLATGATLLAYLLIVPPFEPPDELAHLQYARFVATTGTLPRTVPHPGSEWRASSYEFVQQPLYYLGAAMLLRATGLAEPGPEVALNPRSRMQPGGSEPTLFQHDARSASSTGPRAVQVLRLVSLLMALGTTWLIARLVLTVTADALIVVTVAGGLGLIPQWCAVMTAVSTDPPATLLASAATLAIVYVALGRVGSKGELMAGLLIGAAYAVKATGVFLLPMAVLACLLDAANRERLGSTARLFEGLDRALRAAVGPLLRIGLGVMLTAAWIHVRAWLVFGDPTAFDFKKAILEAGGFVPAAGPMPWSGEFWSQMQVMVFEPFWARFGSLGAGPFPGSKAWPIYGVATAMLVLVPCIGVVGWIKAGLHEVRSGGGGRAACTMLAVSVCALGVGVGLIAWVAVNLLPRADMVVHWTPRHIMPLTAPAALLLASGLERLARATAPVCRAAAAITAVLVTAMALAWLIVLRDTTLMFHFGY
jgi:hypothetical protein